MKLSPDLKSAKNAVKPSVFYALLRSAHVKAAHKMLVKSTPGVNFTYVLGTAFTLVEPKSVKRY
jgi:hypothetical protein